MSDKTLYERLGGYDAIAAVVAALLDRLRNDARLGRFWAHRGADGIAREKQLLIDFLCHSAGADLYYTGREMQLAHRGMAISDDDWSRFEAHLRETLTDFHVGTREQSDTLAFIASTKSDIVEASP